MLDEDCQVVIQECIRLLQVPSEQLRTANRLIGVCIAVRTKRFPTEQMAVRSMLGKPLEELLLKQLHRVTSLVRRKLAFILGELGGHWQFEEVPNTVQVLIEIAQRDSNVDVRAAAADALGKLGGPGAVAALQEIVEQDPVRTVRVRALFALDRLGRPPKYKTFAAISSINQFLERTAAEGDRDTATVARELCLRWKER
jgi:HEAT repeat protein